MNLYTDGQLAQSRTHYTSVASIHRTSLEVDSLITWLTTSRRGATNVSVYYICWLAYLTNDMSNFITFSIHASIHTLGLGLSVAVARFSSDDSAVRYVLPVLWMTSRVPTIGMQANKGDANGR